MYPYYLMYVLSIKIEFLIPRDKMTQNVCKIFKKRKKFKKLGV